ncbi:hypothetical protein [Streptomyces sp. ISL-10]|uniref:hypothetical protein n=1 Tax=Streptomyces sp. ISL-10 TaxID=2819172 RepID=UPI00203536C1|nr:hypothetical protein [Streptomyces sp. ISL-10]
MVHSYIALDREVLRGLWRRMRPLVVEEADFYGGRINGGAHAGLCFGRRSRCGWSGRAVFEEYMMRGWVKAHGLRGVDGELLRFDRRRLRTTFIAQRGQRQWSLRATIDPNHSPQVEGDHYLSAATPAQRARSRLWAASTSG